MRHRQTTIFFILCLAMLMCTALLAKGNTANAGVTDDVQLYFPLIISSDPLCNINPRGQSVEFRRAYMPAYGDIFTTLIEEFNQTNPWNITIFEVGSGGYADLHEAILTAIASGNPPSMALVYPYQAAEYVTYKVLSPLTQYIESPTWGYTENELMDFLPITSQSGYLPQFQERYGWAAYYYAPVLYYNQDWLEELGYTQPPSTWEAFEEMACQAVQQPFSGKTDDRPAIGFKYAPEATWFIAFTLSRGGEILTADGSAYLFNQSPGIDALTQWHEWTVRGCAAPAEYTFADEVDFFAGAALFNISSSSTWRYYQKGVQNDANFNWNAVEIPQTADTMMLPTQNVWGPTYTIFQGTPEEQLAAWLFIKWINEAQQQARMAQSLNGVPTRQSITTYLTDYLAQNPVYGNIIELMSRRSYVERQVIGFNECDSAIGTALSDSFAGWDVETALNEAVMTCNASLTP